MIDIIFLLLIFFIVCSTMDPTKTSSLPDAKHGLAWPANECAVIILEPADNDRVVLRRADSSAFSRDDDAQAAEIIEYIAREMDNADGRGKRHVMLFGDGEVRVREVRRVQSIVGDAFPDLESTFIAVKKPR